MYGDEEASPDGSRVWPSPLSFFGLCGVVA